MGPKQPENGTKLICWLNDWRALPTASCARQVMVCLLRDSMPPAHAAETMSSECRLRFST
jgi:hypothetical protein